jgi:type I restriction enzyme M protein
MIDTFKDIEKLEADLWEAADNLRANSKLTSSDYFIPVLGVIFLRHAANRFEAATRQIEADQAAGRMPRRQLLPADYLRRRALWLPEAARYDWIMQQATTSGGDLPTLVTEAMTAIEAAFAPLQGVLPKDYGIFDEPRVLEDLMRLFNRAQIKQATGDVFGRIYEYFLAKFAIQRAHDNGEFFTPSSLVQTIVNVIEPEGGDTARRVVFYGQEKNRDTIRIAKMNLAVHGLEGKIAEAITYYQDEHTLVGKCDFVMANPPFNVDLVDAERIKPDPRLPFGLPGTNKEKKVGNGNYLWISYFWSYLNDKGRAGFVMSSQASSAGHGEKEVRKQLVETGDVDMLISIRSNFFYTRTVPCELWFFDRAKPADRKDKVLMLDARQVYRKVTRKIYDFSPEQTKNLSAIVWLYRGQQGRFLALMQDYLGAVCDENKAIPAKLAAFEKMLADLRGRFLCLLKGVEKDSAIDTDKKKALMEATTELADAEKPYEADCAELLTALDDYRVQYTAATSFSLEDAQEVWETNQALHTARRKFDPIAEMIRGLIKQVDLLYKLTSRVADLSSELAVVESIADVYDRRTAARTVKQLDEERKATVEQLKHVIYFHRQVVWLQERFPRVELEAVPGLVKLVDKQEIEAADWSLTPGRYVGVAPPEEDVDFDFEATLRDIHTELADLNKEAVELVAKIQANFEGLGV